jgi:hypothetical protein
MKKGKVVRVLTSAGNHGFKLSILRFVDSFLNTFWVSPFCVLRPKLSVSLLFCIVSPFVALDRYGVKIFVISTLLVSVSSLLSHSTNGPIF